MSLAETKGQIEEALEGARAAMNQVALVREPLEAAMAALAGATDGSSRAEPEEVTGSWQQAIDQLSEVENYIGAGVVTGEQLSGSL